MQAVELSLQLGRRVWACGPHSYRHRHLNTAHTPCRKRKLDGFGPCHHTHGAQRPEVSVEREAGVSLMLHHLQHLSLEIMDSEKRPAPSLDPELSFSSNKCISFQAK